MDRIDLRSDTLTAPAAAMRRVPAEAEAGGADHGDDPTVAERPAGDHANARRLAEGPGWAVDGPVETHIVMARFPAAAATVRRWPESGVGVDRVDPHRVRLVTHKDVAAADVEPLLRLSSAA